MENITAFEIVKMNSILHKVLLSNDLEKEISIVGEDDVYNDKMYHYIGIIIEHIDFNKYSFFKTKEVLKNFKELLYLMHLNSFSSLINQYRSKANCIKPIDFADVVGAQIGWRTLSRNPIVYLDIYNTVINPEKLKMQMIKDYDLINYFEGKDCSLDSDNIKSLIYFYNIMKYMYGDIDIYRKTIQLLNVNLDTLKAEKQIFSNKYKDNKKLLKELGGRRVK